MATETVKSSEQVADRVSADTLRRMNFLTGSSLKDLPDGSRFIIIVDGQKRELHFQHGHVRIRRLAD